MGGFKRTANCQCTEPLLLKRSRWVALRRAASPGLQSDLKCNQCGWKWKSKRLYIRNIPDGKERSRRGMTDADILARLVNGTLRVNVETTLVMSEGRYGEWKELKPIFRQPDGCSGYYFFSICHNGKKKKITRHGLVWMAANMEVIPDGVIIDHIHGPKAGDHIGNLRLYTPAANGNHELANIEF